MVRDLNTVKRQPYEGRVGGKEEARNATTWRRDLPKEPERFKEPVCLKPHHNPGVSIRKRLNEVGRAQII